LPKIIKNIREQLLLETKRQISNYGYVNTTIRSVAKSCGVGVGTVYNYFESKDVLIATFLYADWKNKLDLMKKLPSDDPEKLFEGIYDSLLSFSSENEKLFSDPEAAKQISVGSAQRHSMLRKQIADFIIPCCKSRNIENYELTSLFISEALISWSLEKTPFCNLYPLLNKIIN